MLLIFLLLQIFIITSFGSSVGHPVSHPVEHPVDNYHPGTAVVVINNNRPPPPKCTSSQCSPRVCISTTGCVDCTSDSNCGWTSGSRPYCSNNNCVVCTQNAHCSSDTNCDTGCEGNNCVTYSSLNCAINSTYCLPGQRQCVECLVDSHCPSSKPYCRPESHTCEECLTNIHCRNMTQCNAICDGNWTCTTPFNQTYLECNATSEVCYEWLGECLNRCYSDSDCLGSQHCLVNNGKCYDCLNDEHCGTSQNATCGKQCNFHPENLENFCEGGSACDSNHACQLKGSTYQCSDGIIIQPIYITIIILFAISI